MGLRFGSYPSTKLKNIELDFVFGSRFRLKLLTTESSTERTRNFVAVIALDSVFQQAARVQVVAKLPVVNGRRNNMLVLDQITENNVTVLRASGRLTVQDYEKVLPALEEALVQREPLR